MKLKKLIPLSFLFLIPSAMAHCPLCTMGAAVAAGTAAYFGVSQSVIGVFMGAFAVSMGLWFSRMIKKKFEFKFMDIAFASSSFATTILPLLMIMKQFTPLYISVLGDYGSLLNRTYLVNLFLVGSIIGAFITYIAPSISKNISELREGKMIPYQGITLTFSLLALTSILFQILIR